MTLRVAINGFGRIGRNFLRAWFEQRDQLSFEVVAINDLGAPESLAHLLKFDTTHGTFPYQVEQTEKGSQQGICIEELFIPAFDFAQAQSCPWQAYNIDVVLESTGQFRARLDAELHLKAGAKKVVIGAVAFDEVDATIVTGINENSLNAEDKIISAASCTTHCIAPVLQEIDKSFGIEQAFVTEMHAYTSDQQILDHVHRDLRRARAGAQNMIPTTSSSISAVQKALPQLKGKVMGYSMRVPINNVAAVDLTLNLTKSCEVQAVNELFKNFSNKKIIGYSDLPLVSSDFNHRTESAIFDSTQTQILGKTLKVLVWYDNEWGYVNRLLDLFSDTKLGNL
jgi:glyceraldehyde 3-phosphate dehydrogenase